MLMLQRETPAKVQLSQYSYARYMEFADEFSVPFAFRRNGFLSVVTSAKADAALLLAEMRRSLGVPTDILTPHEIADLVPQLYVADIEFGVFGPDDGIIAPLDIMSAYAQAAESRGVDLRLGTPAEGLVISHDRVVGVKTSDGVISTTCVVNAAGAGAAEVAAWAGVTIPIDSRQRSIFVANPAKAVATDSPMVEDAEHEWYFRPEGSGILMGMGREQSSTTSFEPNWDFFPSVSAFASHRAPGLGNLTVTAGWSGLRPLTPDLDPIVGPVMASTDCCFHAAGVVRALCMLPPVGSSSPVG